MQTLQEAGGIVMFVDLVALVYFRWRNAHRAVDHALNSVVDRQTS